MSRGDAVQGGPADSGSGEERPGIDLLLTTQVARLPEVNVSERTVQRWIEKGLPAVQASREQLAEFIRGGYLEGLPPKGAYLIRKADLPLIPSIRAYPKNTKRPRRGKATGAGNLERI